MSSPSSASVTVPDRLSTRRQGETTEDGVGMMRCYNYDARHLASDYSGILPTSGTDCLPPSTPFCPPRLSLFPSPPHPLSPLLSPHLAARTEMSPRQKKSSSRDEGRGGGLMLAARRILIPPSCSLVLAFVFPSQGFHNFRTNPLSFSTLLPSTST